MEYNIIRKWFLIIYTRHVNVFSKFIFANMSKILILYNNNASNNTLTYTSLLIYLLNYSLKSKRSLLAIAFALLKQIPRKVVITN